MQAINNNHKAHRQTNITFSINIEYEMNLHFDHIFLHCNHSPIMTTLSHSQGWLQWGILLYIFIYIYIYIHIFKSVRVLNTGCCVIMDCFKIITVHGQLLTVSMPITDENNKSWLDFKYSDVWRSWYILLIKFQAISTDKKVPNLSSVPNLPRQRWLTDNHSLCVVQKLRWQFVIHFYNNLLHQMCEVVSCFSIINIVMLLFEHFRED